MVKRLVVYVATAALCVGLFSAAVFAAPSPDMTPTNSDTTTTDTSSTGSTTKYTCGKDSQGKDIVTTIDFGELCKKDGANPITAIILWAINFLAVGVGIAVVIGIIIGGIKYAMSDGDEGKAKEGRETIVNAVIGLFLFIFMYAAANFLIPGGLFK